MPGRVQQPLRVLAPRSSEPRVPAPPVLESRAPVVLVASALQVADGAFPPAEVRLLRVLSLRLSEPRVPAPPVLESRALVVRTLVVPALRAAAGVSPPAQLRLLLHWLGCPGMTAICPLTFPLPL